jgi:hypothetical protein
MKAGMMLRFGLFAVACVMVFAGAAAFYEAAAQETPTKSDEPKAAKKPKPKGDTAKSADADGKPKKGQYATEAEAKARCKGTVVWIDKDKFQHYEGSREWGRKPGVFACEQG